MKISLTLQIVIAVILGAFLGYLMPGRDFSVFAEIGRTIIQWIKLVAGPFVFFTILEAMIEVKVSWKHGGKILLIAITNTSIALVIGASLAYLFLPVMKITELGNIAAPNSTVSPQMSWMSFIKGFSPKSIFEPFFNNDILLLALFGLILGIAVRASLTEHREQHLVRDFARAANKIAHTILEWIIRLIPLAIFLLICATVSQYGFGIFAKLGPYIVVVILGFLLQIFFVYGFWNTIFAKISAKKLLIEAREALSFAFGANSSLAALPYTFKALKRLGVSDRSASMGAGLFTNLNNDGIVLYEAAAVYFVANLYGITMSWEQMLGAGLTCLVAAMGIAGVPEAGFVSLTIVLANLGLPAEALPLLLSIDWILARCRSVVNVFSDMTLSIALDKWEK